MDPKELRIGNWLCSTETTGWGDTWQFDFRVTEIWEHRFSGIVYTHHGSGIVSSDYEGVQVAGEQLTSEWLLKFGLVEGVSKFGMEVPNWMYGLNRFIGIAPIGTIESAEWYSVHFHHTKVTQVILLP